jgi:rRNA-processing protein FCF1
MATEEKLTSKQIISRIYSLMRGVVSPEFVIAELKKKKNAKGGKLKLAHGGKAKKKYGVVGKPILKKGGKAK